MPFVIIFHRTRCLSNTPPWKTGQMPRTRAVSYFSAVLKLIVEIHDVQMLFCLDVNGCRWSNKDFFCIAFFALLPL